MSGALVVVGVSLAIIAVAIIALVIVGVDEWRKRAAQRPHGGIWAVGGYGGDGGNGVGYGGGGDGGGCGGGGCGGGGNRRSAGSQTFNRGRISV